MVAKDSGLITLLMQLGNSLNVLLSLLFRVIVIHGHYPRNLLVPTIISIPKDLKSCLCKVDNFVICGHLICGHSKAFDRVHYEKLFNILLSKKLPICIIRMLLDCYVRQESRASWSSYYTVYFTMSNGVKQGGVLSAILFTLYLDKLLIRLKNSNIGCSIMVVILEPYHTLIISLSCPSIRGLNRMLEICNSFAAEHNLIFNTNKSLEIKYGEPVCASEAIYLGGNKIRWESSVCHLGNYFDTKLSDMIDCKMKCSSFIGSVNRIMANFGHLQSHILSQIFKTHCCTFYGSTLW